MRWLRLRSPDPKARRRVLEDLCARDAVRAAEEIVSAEWINTLEITTARNAVTRDLLERERVVYAHAERKRTRAAERDQRRLTVLARSAGLDAPAEESLRSSPVDGSAGAA